MITWAGVRLNPGLDDAKTIERYGQFFKAVQATIDEALKGTDGMDEKAVQKKVIEAIDKFQMPRPKSS